MEHLPLMVWEGVVDLLGDRDRLALSLVCRDLGRVCDSPRYWKKLKVVLFHSSKAALGFSVSGRRVKKSLDWEEGWMLEKYSQHVRCLTLRVVNCPRHCHLSSRCLQQLQRYSRRWPVRTLTLHLSGQSASPQRPPRPWVTFFSLVVAPSWSDTLQELTILCDMTGHPRRRWRVLELLGGRLPASRPVRLNMHSCRGQHGSSYRRDVLSVVGKVASLKELSVHHNCLSGNLLSRLRRVAGLQLLRVHYTASCSRAVTAVADRWSQLVQAKPGLAVEVVLHSRDLFTREGVAGLLPPPSVPVRACYLQDTDNEVLANDAHSFKRLLDLLRNYARTLSTFHLNVNVTRSEGDVVAFVTQCSELQHLVLHGWVRASTILRLARLEREWRTFTFTSDIAFDKMDLPHCENVRQLCESVSAVKSLKSWKLDRATREQRRRVVFAPECEESDLKYSKVITVQFP